MIQKDFFGVEALKHVLKPLSRRWGSCRKGNYLLIPKSIEGCIVRTRRVDERLWCRKEKSKCCLQSPRQKSEKSSHPSERHNAQIISSHNTVRVEKLFYSRAPVEIIYYGDTMLASRGFPSRQRGNRSRKPSPRQLVSRGSKSNDSETISPSYREPVEPMPIVKANLPRLHVRHYQI
jgi:hypothetical protein